MLGLFDGHAVDMVDLLADGVIRETVGAAGQGRVVGCRIERRQRMGEVGRIHDLREARHMLLGNLGFRVALAHQHPAAIAQHGLAGRIEPVERT